MTENQEILEKLDQIIFWMKFSAMSTFIPILRNSLRDDIDKLVYELSDGERTTREIAQKVTESGRKISHVTVANMWEKWQLQNLVLEANRKGRFKRIISLESIGMKIPESLVSVDNVNQEPRENQVE